MTLAITGARRSLSATCSALGQNLSLGTGSEAPLIPHSGGSSSCRSRSLVRRFRPFVRLVSNREVQSHCCPSCPRQSEGRARGKADISTRHPHTLTGCSFSGAAAVRNSGSVYRPTDSPPAERLRVCTLRSRRSRAVIVLTPTERGKSRHAVAPILQACCSGPGRNPRRRVAGLGRYLVVRYHAGLVNFLQGCDGTRATRLAAVLILQRPGIRGTSNKDVHCGM